MVQLRRGDRDREKRSRIFPGNELFLRGSVASVLNGEEAISVYETMLHSLNTQEAYMQSYLTRQKCTGEIGIGIGEGDPEFSQISTF